MTLPDFGWKDRPDRTTPLRASELETFGRHVYDHADTAADGLYVSAYFVNNDIRLYFAVSPDLVSWQPLGKVPDTTLLRDPNLKRINNQWFVAATGGPAANGFVVMSGSTLRTVAKVAEVPAGDVAWTYCWAPKWFVEDNGDVYLIVSATTGADLATAVFHLYAMKATNAALTVFAAPVQLTGSLASSQIDGQVTKVGSTYHLFAKYNDAANQANSRVEHYTAASLTGPYTGVQTGDALLGATGYVEAPNLLPRGGNSYRLFYDIFNKGGECWYVDSADGMVTWGSPAQVDNPDAVRHASFVDARSIRTTLAEAFEHRARTRYQPKRWRARGSRVAGSLNLVNNAYTAITWDTWTDPYYRVSAVADSKRCFNAAGDFIAPFAGSFRFSGQIAWNAGAVTSQWVAAWFINGTAAVPGDSAEIASGDHLCQPLPVITYDLAKGDIVTARAFHNSGADRALHITSGARNFMEVEWLA